MPIYEYRCKTCGEVFEVIQKVGERPLRRCRSCSGPVEKLVSRTAFLLKGGGWFAEGYGSGKPSDKASSESSATSTETKGGDKSAGDTGKSDSKSTKASAAGP